MEVSARVPTPRPYCAHRKQGVRGKSFETRGISQRGVECGDTSYMLVVLCDEGLKLRVPMLVKPCSCGNSAQWCSGPVAA